VPRLWPVFLVYVAAFVGVVAASLVAALVVHDLYPDVPAQAALEGLPGLIAGGLASSAVLVLTVLFVTRPLLPVTLRLLPGRERGVDLAAMIVGTLALGQALDSASMLAGVGQQGAMAMIQRALRGATGPDLFNAVLVIGVMAGAAEETFFRGYMQTRLRARWPAWAAVIVTSVGFALLHLEWIHAALAFVLGVYFGVLTELSGSALPAMACHIINNVLFTMLTAIVGSVEGAHLNAILLAVSALVFVACAAWLRSSLGTPAPPSPRDHGVA
jgi:membrane protease YdiL (CAAX protease family)